MKLKVIVVSIEVPARVKWWVLRLGVPALLLAGGGVAYADFPTTWKDGDVLTAKMLTANFSYLEDEIAGDGGIQKQIENLQGQVVKLQNAKGLYVSQQDCTYAGSPGQEHTTCLCKPTEKAISGGGYNGGGSAIWMQGSNIGSRADQWDVACANAAGTRVQCTYAFVVCVP